eukprot:scaffold52401_cov54-Phaeocystis_antarctica.AAC.1
MALVWLFYGVTIAQLLCHLSSLLCHLLVRYSCLPLCGRAPKDAGPYRGRRGKFSGTKCSIYRLVYTRQSSTLPRSAHAQPLGRRRVQPGRRRALLARVVCEGGGGAT